MTEIDPTGVASREAGAGTTASNPFPGPAADRADRSSPPPAALLLLTTFAAALRAWLATAIPVIQQDAAGGYLHQARAMLRGDWAEGLGTYFPPGYPLAVFLVGLPGLDVVTAGHLVSVICGALLVFPVFRLASDLYDTEAAWIAAALTAVYPALVLTSADAISEGLYTLIVIAVISLGYRWLVADSVSLGAAAGLGALWGAAYLVRGEALGMLAFFLLLGAGRSLLAPGEYRRSWGGGRLGRSVAAVAALLAGFLVIAGPYMVFLRAEKGRLELSGKTMENLLAYDLTDAGQPVDIEAVRLGLAPDGRSLGIDLRKQESPLRFLWENRGRQARRYLRNATEAYVSCLPRTLYPAFLLLLGIGVYRSARTKAGTLMSVYMGCFFAFPFFFYPVFLVESRYFVPIVPLGLVWAAGGLCAAVRNLSAGMRRRTLLAATLLLVVAHSAPLAMAVRSDRWALPVEHRAAGEWLRQRDPTHPRIMNRKSYVGFYADGITVITPNAGYRDLLIYARARRVDYLVVDDRFTLAVRPGLRFLLDSEETPAELERIYEAKEHRGARIAIFRLRPAEPDPRQP